MKACPCGQALDPRNASGLCKWCYHRWRYQQSSRKGQALSSRRGCRKMKTILKGLP